MTFLTPTEVFRGNPPSDDHQPIPSQIVDLLDRIMTMIGVGASFYEDTLADLTAVSGAADGDIGFVLADGTASNNGVYRHNGTSWVKTADLPEGLGPLGLDAITAKTDQLSVQGDEGPLWSVGDGSRMQFWLDAAGNLRGPWPDRVDATLLRRDENGPIWSVGGAAGQWGGVVAPMWIHNDAEFTVRNPFIDRVAEQSARKTPRPRVYIAGDSRGDQSTNDGRTTAYGWAAHLHVLTGARFDVANADNVAVAGSTSEEMLAAVGPLLTAEPGIVVAITSTNDRTEGWSAARSIAAMALFQTLVLGRGHQLVWIAELPRGDADNGTYTLAGSDLLAHFRVHQWIMDQSAVHGVYVADPWPSMCDHDSADGHVQTGLMYDGLHTGVPGARLVAEALAPVFTALLPPRPRLIASAADLYSTSNPSGSLLTNPMMGGTSGTAGAGASGQVADDWAVTVGAGMAAVCSKTTLDGRPSQRVVVSGAPTAAKLAVSPVDPTPHSVVISADIVNTSYLEVGDVVEVTGDFALAAGSVGCRAVSLYLTITTASGTTTHCAMEPNLARSFPNLDQPGSEFAGPLVVPQFTVTEAVTAASVSIMIVGAPHDASYSDVTIGATVDFTAISMRKVIQ